MVQEEVEQIAREIRTKIICSSWNELLEFSESVVGNLVDVYQSLLKNSVLSDNYFPIDRKDAKVLIENMLGKALVSLTTPEQVAKWRSEVIT